MKRFRVTFHRAIGKNENPMPRRTFFVLAEDQKEAFEIAKTIEVVLERPAIYRARSLTSALIEALTSEDEE